MIKSKSKTKVATRSAARKISKSKSPRRYWLAEAEKWSRLAQDEISSHYDECNVIQSASGTASVVSRSAA